MNKKIVLITGSSRGIGKAIATAFAKENTYKIVLNCNTDILNMELLKDELLQFNNEVMCIKCDVSNNNEVVKMFETIAEKWGKVDVLINNAGICHVGLFSDMTIAECNHIVNTNILSVVNCSHQCISSMVSKKSGVIINISSIWGEVGASCEVIYSMSKAGVNGFTKALAKEVAPSNVKVNAISCGVIDTDMNKWLTQQEKNDIIESIPMNHMGTADDISKLCLFLASENSSYITGQVIRIDGGFL